ncbi:hypothetical protein CR513_24890, partial [Mucuna pruriens]
MLDKGSSNTGFVISDRKRFHKRINLRRKTFHQDKEEMDYLRALLNSISKPHDSCALTMKGKSSFFIVMFVSFQNIVQHFLLLLLVTISEDKWCISFIDDCITWIFLMKHKLRLWLDNGTKFANLEFFKFLKDNGVIHELVCVNTPK